MTLSSVGLAPSIEAVMRPSPIVRMRRRSGRGSPAARRRSARSRRRPAASCHKGVNLGLGADIDAARRLVEDQELRLHAPSTWRERSSAGCRPKACRRRRGEAARISALLEQIVDRALASRPAGGRARPAHQRQRGVVLRAHAEHEALALAVLGHEADAELDRVRGGLQCDLRPSRRACPRTSGGRRRSPPSSRCGRRRSGRRGRAPRRADGEVDPWTRPATRGLRRAEAPRRRHAGALRR